MSKKILEICGERPCAVAVVNYLATKSHLIDPSIDAKDLISQMKEYGITKERICRFYRDVCGEEFGRMIGLLCACKLDIITQSALLHAIDNNGEGINVDEVVNKVKQQTRGKATESHSGTHIEMAPESGIVSEICGDNPFAKEVVDKLFTESSQIDPSIDLNDLILQMKEYGITGERIWQFYKYYCNEKIDKIIQTLHYWKLKNLPPKLLLSIIDAKMREYHSGGSEADKVVKNEMHQTKGKETGSDSGTERQIDAKTEIKLKNEIRGASPVPVVRNRSLKNRNQVDPHTDRIHEITKKREHGCTIM